MQHRNSAPLLWCYNADLIAQAIHVIERLKQDASSDFRYAQVVGPHIRHLIDHYDAFVLGLEFFPSGTVQYDVRRRDQILQSQPLVAIARLNVLQDRLRAIAAATREPYPLDAAVQVVSCAGFEGEFEISAASTIGRELLFLSSHMVHHFALLAHYCAGTPSRGALVTDFLNTELAAHAYLAQVADVAAYYNPFNLLVFDGQRLLGLQSREARIVECAPGFGALSNADFDTPWLKLTRLKNGLAELVGNGLATDAALLALLRDETIPPDALLPQTGITLERERVLSCAFVAGSDYGTRASSLVRLGRAQADFTETCFHANDMRATRRVVWPLVPAKPPARMSLRSRPLQAPMD